MAITRRGPYLYCVCGEKLLGIEKFKAHLLSSNECIWKAIEVTAVITKTLYQIQEDPIRSKETISVV